MSEQNNINDNSSTDVLYEETLEKTKDEAVAKGLDVDHSDLCPAANKQFAERVLDSEDYGDLKDFCERLTPSQMNYVDQQIAQGKNRASFVRKLADIAKDSQLTKELRSKPLSEFKKEVSSLKQGLHKSSRATAIPVDYKHSDVPDDFKSEFKKAQDYFRNRGY